ncbi:MAG: Hsp20/alpha crystallin family protein [Planctomycetes bacterium]|nr:Hsp20/alpha crystallin family protein [Planctomycetota bacterium]
MATETRDIEVRQAQQPVQAERVERVPAFAPAADVFETAQGAVVLVDLPGCDEGSVDIRVEDGVLTIRGRVQPEGFPGHDLTYGEYRVGDFERSFSVSELIDTERIEATVKDGVLRVSLPKVEAAKPKKIQVKVS